MSERNWAEHDKQVRESPTLKQAEDTGRIHKSYLWAKSPYGGWDEEYVAAYNRGYDGE